MLASFKLRFLLHVNWISLLSQLLLLAVEARYSAHVPHKFSWASECSTKFVFDVGWTSTSVHFRNIIALSNLICSPVASLNENVYFISWFWVVRLLFSVIFSLSLYKKTEETQCSMYRTTYNLLLACLWLSLRWLQAFHFEYRWTRPINSQTKSHSQQQLFQDIQQVMKSKKKINET